MSTLHYHSISQWRNTLPGDWSSWKWQMQNAIRDSGSLNEILSTFTDHRCSAVPGPKETGYFSLKITPHMVLGLKNALEQSVPGAWKAFSSGFVPNENEFANLSFEREGIDCIGEELSVFNPVPSITNFYRSRVLFRVTNMCPAYCRYCFRRRMVGDGLGAWNESSINEGISYISNNNEIREVILSGGDPLVLSDDKLGFVLESLSKIPHVRRLRIDSKALTMIPQRITEEFVQLLSKHQPIYFIAHFAHTYELTQDTKDACLRLANAGIPLGSHTPLLKGISDDETSLASLMETLVDLRVQPYYLIHFIPTKWTEHFRVPLARGVELVRYLFKNCGGLATPTLIVYLPEGGGKVPVSFESVLEKTEGGYLFESLDGRKILYPEPSSIPHMKMTQ